MLAQGQQSSGRSVARVSVWCRESNQRQTLYPWATPAAQAKGKKLPPVPAANPQELRYQLFPVPTVQDLTAAFAEWSLSQTWVLNVVCSAEEKARLSYRVTHYGSWNIFPAEFSLRCVFSKASIQNIIRKTQFTLNIDYDVTVCCKWECQPDKARNFWLSPFLILLARGSPVPGKSRTTWTIYITGFLRGWELGAEPWGLAAHLDTTPAVQGEWLVKERWCSISLQKPALLLELRNVSWLIWAGEELSHNLAIIATLEAK